jgi:hypothetical protein
MAKKTKKQPTKQAAKQPPKRRLSDEERERNIAMELDPDDDRPLAQKVGEHIAFLKFMGRPVPEEYPRILEML